MLELAWRGEKPLTMPNGETRSVLKDGDTVTMRGWCENAAGLRVGVGSCEGKLLPARLPAGEVAKPAA